MAHFAWLDENNIVYDMSRVDNENILDENGNESEAIGIAYLSVVHHPSRHPARWVQTSYNNNFRGKYAGFGDKYDEENDVFISPPPAPKPE